MSTPLDGSVLGEAILEIEKKCTTKAAARAIELVRAEVWRARQEEAELLGFFWTIQGDVSQEERRQAKVSK